MRKILLVILVATSFACSNRFTLPGGLVNDGYGAGVLGQNIMAVQVGDCGFQGGVNVPCVTVTICTPGTNNCQSIPNVLLDTGSYGLRLFSSTVSVSLPQATDPSGHGVAECAAFGSGSTWGTINTAGVYLAGESQVTVPVQIINSTYGSVPTTCTDLYTDPGSTGFNGILGVGLIAADCGDGCASDSANETYYSCVGTSCTNIVMPVAQQVTNPVALLSQDNNGVVVNLPGVTSAGSGTISGTLTLGIGTQANNMPSGVTMFPADQYANFQTTYAGTNNNQSFIDSGSNGLFFPGTLTACGSNEDGFFCPASVTSLSATMYGATGTAAETVAFQIGNADTLFNSGNTVFNNVGGSMTGSFDWGLPFFLNRTVYVGLDGQNSSLGTGPYWAY